MDNAVFLFDLDSTVTKQEILPTIALEIDKGDEMRALTESTMMGEIPFEESFKSRIKILQDISVSKVSSRTSDIELSPEITNFILKYHKQCYIVTSNLDVWIEKLLKKLKLSKHVFCSNARVENDKIVGIDHILKKEESVITFSNKKTIAIGDGSNDYKFLKQATIGIAYGGVRNIAPSLFEVCDYAAYEERTLCRLLNTIRNEQ